MAFCAKHKNNFKAIKIGSIDFYSTMNGKQMITDLYKFKSNLNWIDKYIDKCTSPFTPMGKVQQLDELAKNLIFSMDSLIKTNNSFMTFGRQQWKCEVKFFWPTHMAKFVRHKGGGDKTGY